MYQYFTYIYTFLFFFLFGREFACFFFLSGPYYFFILCNDPPISDSSPAFQFIIFKKFSLHLFLKPAYIYIKMKFSNCWSKGCLFKTKVSSGVTDKHIYRKTCISLKCSNSSGKRDGHYFYCSLCNRHYPKRDKILRHLQSKKHKNRLSSENYFLENIGTSKVIDGSPKMLNDDMTTDSPNMYNDDPVQDDVTTFLFNEETECFSSENKSQQFFSGKILPDQFCPEILFPSLSTKNPKQCMVVNSYNNKVVNNSLEMTMD